MTVSREAREFRALALLARDVDIERATLAGESVVPMAPMDHTVFLADAQATRALEPATARVFAEAYVAGETRRARNAYGAAWRSKTFKLRGEATPVPIETLASVVTTERGVARREALIAAGDVAAKDLRTSAIAMVESVRNTTDAVGTELSEALGGGDAGADAILDATEEILRELDARVTRRLELDRTRLTWADRLRSLAAESLPMLVPPAAWTLVASQWMFRVDLASSARRIHDELRPAARTAAGMVVLAAEGNGAVVAGRPTNAGVGALEVAGALAEALVCVTGVGLTAGERRGVDAGVAGLGRALGRRLYLNRHFVRREAGIDVVQRERAMVEALHAEVVTVRLDAALARFAAMARAREGDLAGRFVAEVTRAVGCAPSPVWAVHMAARALLPEGRWGARVAGSLAEPVLTDWLRQRYDEDWFRNPRAGAGLVNVLQDVRLSGTLVWREAMAGKGSDAAAALTRRLSDALREAQRISS